MTEIHEHLTKKKKSTSKKQ